MNLQSNKNVLLVPWNWNSVNDSRLLLPKYISNNFAVFFLRDIRKRVLLNSAPTSTQLHPPPPSSFQPPPSSLQRPEQYLNQNIAPNWATSPNLGRKIQSCPIWLRISTHGILEVLISNPDIDVWNFDPKIHFWANLGRKIQSCPFCLKIGAHGISRMLIPNPDLDLRNLDPKIYFWASFGPKTQSCQFCLKIGTHGISRMLILISTFNFLISN